MYKRSEWLRNWNRRELVASPGLLSWFSGERQTGSLVLEKNCFITTSVDGRLVVQSAGREVQFRCHDRARLSDWLRAVQSAARPAPPGGAPSSVVADYLPTSAALSTFADAIGAPSCSPPPPPQLLSKEAIAQINWGKMVYRPTPISPCKSPSRAGTDSGSSSSLGMTQDAYRERGSPKSLFRDEPPTGGIQDSGVTVAHPQPVMMPAQGA